MADRRRDHSGSTVVVTGAASGIGRATALAFARLGAKLHVADLDGEGAEAVRAEIEASGPAARAHELDVTDAAGVGKLAELVYSEDGRCDVLVNNAGIGHGGAVEDTELEVWRRVIDVNLMGTVHGVHHFVPRMLAQGEGGHIVNIASALGLVAMPELGAYCASKYGVVGLTESLDSELAPKGIRVTAICPGIVDTSITRSAEFRGDIAGRAEHIRRFYAERGASPDVVAEAILESVEQPRTIRTVPRSHVVPLWAAKRLSPRLYQAATRRVRPLFERLTR